MWHYVSMDVPESAEGESLILWKEGVEPQTNSESVNGSRSTMV